jgi:hypothetical protein
VPLLCFIALATLLQPPAQPQDECAIPPLPHAYVKAPPECPYQHAGIVPSHCLTST